MIQCNRCGGILPHFANHDSQLKACDCEATSVGETPELPNSEGAFPVATGSDAVLLMELQALVNVWREIAASLEASAKEHEMAHRYDYANWKYEVAEAYELCGKQLQRLLGHPGERQPHPNNSAQTAATKIYDPKPAK